jgi:hypothetical protein
MLKVSYELTHQVLPILNGPGDFHGQILHVLQVIKSRMEFDAVGLRLQDGNDFPYLAQIGFPQDFLLTENSLIAQDSDGRPCRDIYGTVCLECTCGLVLSGKADSTYPNFTAGGSFWTNDSFSILDMSPTADPRFHPRNRCIHRGYASVALVPIRNKGRIVGLLQINDQSKGRFTPETLELLEGFVTHIGAALLRKQAEEEQSRSSGVRLR